MTNIIGKLILGGIVNISGALGSSYTHQDVDNLYPDSRLQNYGIINYTTDNISAPCQNIYNQNKSTKDTIDVIGGVTLITGMLAFLTCIKCCNSRNQDGNDGYEGGINEKYDVENQHTDSIFDS